MYKDKLIKERQARIATIELFQAIIDNNPDSKHTNKAYKSRIEIEKARIKAIDTLLRGF